MLSTKNPFSEKNPAAFGLDMAAATVFCSLDEIAFAAPFALLPLGLPDLGCADPIV
jgi:hypothetical protein